jgi:hypothetical protein
MPYAEIITFKGTTRLELFPTSLPDALADCQRFAPQLGTIQAITLWQEFSVFWEPNSGYSLDRPPPVKEPLASWEFCDTPKGVFRLKNVSGRVHLELSLAEVVAAAHTFLLAIPAWSRGPVHLQSTDESPDTIFATNYRTDTTPEIWAPSAVRASIMAIATELGFWALRGTADLDSAAVAPS